MSTNDHFDIETTQGVVLCLFESGVDMIHSYLLLGWYVCVAGATKRERLREE